MRAKTFYQIALWLPIALPAAIWFLRDSVPSGATPIGNMAGWILLSGFIGGVPYLLFAFGAAIWMRGQAPSRVRRAVVLAPLLFLAVFLCYWLVAGISNGSAVPGFLTAGLGLGMFVLLFGFGYVVVVESLRWVGTWVKIVGPMEGS